LDITDTANPMIDPLPPHKRMQVRAMLAGTFRGTAGLSSSEQKAAKEGSRPARSPSPPDASRASSYSPRSDPAGFRRGRVRRISGLIPSPLEAGRRRPGKVRGSFPGPHPPARLPPDGPITQSRRIPL